MKVFFDVDGVLIDGWHSSPERRKPWDIQLERDLGVGRERFQNAFFRSSGGGSPSLMSACVKGDLDLKEALAIVLPGLGYAGPVEEFVRYWFENDSNVNEEVLAIVKSLNSSGEADLYLVTGQEHYRADYLWNGLGLREHFADILYSARLGYRKSEAGFYATINSVLGINPDDPPIHFDDEESVVRLARAAGWDAHVFNGPEDINRHERLRALLD